MCVLALVVLAFPEPELRPGYAQRHRDDHVPRGQCGGGGAVWGGYLQWRRCGQITGEGFGDS